MFWKLLKITARGCCQNDRIQVYKFSTIFVKDEKIAYLLQILQIKTYKKDKTE